MCQAKQLTVIVLVVVTGCSVGPGSCSWMVDMGGKNLHFPTLLAMYRANYDTHHMSPVKRAASPDPPLERGYSTCYKCWGCEEVSFHTYTCTSRVGCVRLSTKQGLAAAMGCVANKKGDVSNLKFIQQAVRDECANWKRRIPGATCSGCRGYLCNKAPLPTPSPLSRLLLALIIIIG